MTTNNSDGNITLIQEQLFQWLLIKETANWRQIHAVCNQLTEPFKDCKYFCNYPIYKLLYPLINIGLIDVAYVENTNKIFFSIAPNCLIENRNTFIGRKSFDSFFYEQIFDKNIAIDKSDFKPLCFLQSLPTVHQIINSFKDANNVCMIFKCHLENKYKFEECYNTKETGIYKQDNKVYLPSFIVDESNNLCKKIPDYDTNYESINWARCYVRNMNDEKFFRWNKQTKELFLNRYSEIPTLVFRALILCEPEQLLDTEYYKVLNKNQPLRNIDENIIKEIQRIFGENTVENIND